MLAATRPRRSIRRATPARSTRAAPKAQPRSARRRHRRSAPLRTIRPSTRRRATSRWPTVKNSGAAEPPGAGLGSLSSGSDWWPGAGAARARRRGREAAGRRRARIRGAARGGSSSSGCAATAAAVISARRPSSRSSRSRSRPPSSPTSSATGPTDQFRRHRTVARGHPRGAERDRSSSGPTSLGRDVVVRVVYGTRVCCSWRAWCRACSRCSSGS